MTLGASHDVVAAAVLSSCPKTQKDIPHTLLQPFCTFLKQHFVCFPNADQIPQLQNTALRSSVLQTKELSRAQPSCLRAQQGTEETQAWSPAWPPAGPCRPCSHSHCSWCLLTHSSFPVCSLFQGTPGPVQTGMSTQEDVARGRVCGAWQCTNSPCVQDKILPSEKVWGQHEWKYLCKLA